MKIRQALILLPSISLLWTAACSESAQDPGAQQLLEKKFEESMANVTLEGFFKTDTPDSKLRPERYSITKISKLAGNYWIFQARIQYGERDVSLPVPVTINWVDDTPVLTLTEATIPGLGTFSARLLFYDGQYVGVWRHGEHSGQHFGRIVPGGARRRRRR